MKAEHVIEQPAETRVSRATIIVWTVLCLATVYRLGHMTPFMFDATNKQYAIQPTIREFTEEALAKPFFDRHNCFTSYVIATHLADNGAENIYQPTLYRDAEEETPIHETIGETLTIDTYQYPPPFLLLPKLLMIVAGDFFSVRTVWFFLNLAVFGVTAILLTRWLGGHAFGRFWFMMPLVLLATSTLAGLQIGNAHFLIISLSILGMLFLEQRRYLLGGSILGFAIVSKVFPGLLLVYLLFRRRWRALAYTGTAMVGFCALTLAVFGSAPLRAFVDYQLPRLASGEAFAFAREYIRPMLGNSSVMGAVYKLNELDWLGGADPDSVARVVMWVYTGVLLIVTALAGAHHWRVAAATGFVTKAPADLRLHMARIWFVLIILAQLRSPFLPSVYGNIAILWLLTLLLPTRDRWRAKTMALAAAWLIFAVPIPLPFGPAEVSLDFGFTLGAFGLVVGICAVIIARRVPQAIPSRLGTIQ